MSDEKVVKIGARGRKKGESTPYHHHNHEGIIEPVVCSFCGRSNTEVLKMVKGPGVNICSECTMIAVQYLIMQDRMLSEEAQQILDTFWGKKN